MAKPENELKFENRNQWRGWLEENHAGAREAWLVIFKQAYRDQGLALGEAVEEALCFGWIDGQLAPRDERCYILRFSPRKPGSIWSVSNIRRVERLRVAGKMTPAGEVKVRQAQESGAWEDAFRRERVDDIPPALERALREHRGAEEAYRALPVARRKQYLYWLQQAKREETRQKRIAKIVREVLDR